MRLVLYLTYLGLVSTQVLVACICAAQRRWNGWRRWGKTAFFGVGALTSLSLAKDVLTKDSLRVPLTGGLILWGSFVRMLALVAVCYGLWRARQRREEDVT